MAIERLKRIGFTNVDSITLFGDEVYRSYFVRMLRDILTKKVSWKGTIETILEEMGESRLP